MKTFVGNLNLFCFIHMCTREVSNEVEVETVILYWYYNNNLEKEVMTIWL